MRARPPASLLALLGAIALLAAGGPAAFAQGYSEPGGATPATEPKASLPDIEDEVMCPVCGTLLALAAEAPQANDQRKLIRRLIDQGLTKEEIKERLVDEFGPEVLATPDTEGFDLAAWVVPGLAIVLVGGAIFVGLRRWRRDGGDDDEPPAAGGLASEDAKRLDEDLARYEL
jgi:cytochrome c-type biogenesis protein CcmH